VQWPIGDMLQNLVTSDPRIQHFLVPTL
jgi:hypothetical protein